MSAILPKSRPQISQKEIQKLLSKRSQDSVIAFGLRGYYKVTMGNPLKNDRGLYDDAIGFISPTMFAVFNGNTDPSVFRKGIATLFPGVHRYKMGNHGISRPGGGYPAFRPATKNEELPVTRDGISIPWPGVAINIHKGSFNGTSSEGCQTIYPSQWDAFYHGLVSQLKAYNQKTFDYVLIDF